MRSMIQRLNDFRVVTFHFFSRFAISAVSTRHVFFFRQVLFADFGIGNLFRQGKSQTLRSELFLLLEHSGKQLKAAKQNRLTSFKLVVALELISRLSSRKHLHGGSLLRHEIALLHSVELQGRSSISTQQLLRVIGVASGMILMEQSQSVHFCFCSASTLASDAFVMFDLAKSPSLVSSTSQNTISTAKAKFNYLYFSSSTNWLLIVLSSYELASHPSVFRLGTTSDATSNKPQRALHGIRRAS